MSLAHMMFNFEGDNLHWIHWKLELFLILETSLFQIQIIIAWWLIADIDLSLTFLFQSCDCEPISGLQQY